MATPSIAMTPSAVKAGKVYSVLPSDGIGDFDFTRASTATRINSKGLIETVATGVPRLDYSNGDCPSLLLENQSTNLVTYSENFSDYSWVKNGSSITSNSVISPDGTQNASTLIGSTVNSRHQIRKGFLNSVDASFSLFVKAKELKYLQIASANTGNQYVNFDVESGIIGTAGISFSSAKIENYGNGWYRVSVVSLNQYNSYIISLVSGLNVGWLESWVMPNNTDGLYIWGAQLEENSYATSYIPTLTGTTQTRSAETCGGVGDASSINSEEGVLYAEISALANTGTYRSISLSDGTNTNRVNLTYSNSNNRLTGFINSNGDNADFNFTQNPITDFIKCAFKYKQNECALWVNGVEIASTVSQNTFNINTLTELSFTSGSSSSIFEGNTKDLRVYNTALDDATLAELTTP